MKNIEKFIGLSGDHDNPGCAWQIVAMREGTGKRYPSIKNGVELSWDDPEYHKYKTITISKVYYLTVMGNPVACEGYLKRQGLRAYAIGPHTVQILFNERNEIFNN